MAEPLHFVTCLEAYLMDGFSGNVPTESIQFQVAPLINNIWWTILVDRGIKKLDLESVLNLITQLGAEFNPLHQRRLAVFNVRKNQDDHSMFLHKLEEAVDMMDFGKMTRDQFVIHLFLGQADQTMGKEAANFLQLGKEEQRITNFRTAIRRIETAPWYGASSSKAKYVGLSLIHI